MALKDLPYIPFYVQDFACDEKLAMCSAAATGVYIRLMCILHKSKTYGAVKLRIYSKGDSKTYSKSVANGIAKPIASEKQDFEFATNLLPQFAESLQRQMPYTAEEVLNALEELCFYGVINIEGDTLSQPRMVRDGEMSEKRRVAGRSGGKTRWSKGAEAAAEDSKTYSKSKANDIANHIANTVAKPEATTIAKPIAKVKQNTENDIQIYNIKECKKKGAGEKDGEREKAQKPGTSFTPPTKEEVEAYCQERGNNVNAQLFIDHYTANGWVQGGRSKIKDWKACVRTWEQNGVTRQAHGTEPAAAESGRSEVRGTATEKKTRRTTL